ncbi:glycosyltransferase family 2 protein [Dyadobacter sp. CY312]|uniref:glycosyltransferase family 2 protein n=1 Tax=Dyadobacter sp. CY312 TaxID=2907303 RepID=UPI001F33A771|nr:glycosyltransferase family 2 protein [Dyadobacter sp. CY312]MCE7041278.1 glycosyltransferase family 2 protein [Dyadobacter sp. CY312]
MDVSIIIVNYNTKALTLASIESVYKHTEDVTFEIILVDNASQEEIYSDVANFFPLVKIILNSENVGFGRANNLGILMAQGEFIFLLNSDAFLTSNALKHFKNFMKDPANNNVAICGGELHTGGKDNTVSYGNFPTLSDAFSSIGFYKLYKSYHAKHIASGVVNINPSIREVDYICGANMFIRKSILNIVGYFDADFFLYFEETELSYRIRKNGYVSKIVPTVKIIHLSGASQNNKSNFNYSSFSHFCRGRSLYFQKCHGSLYSFAVNVCYALTEINLSLLGKKKGNIIKKIKIIFSS